MQLTKLRWVLILGGVVMAGIIGMQAYWVSSTWNLNEEDFSKKAHLALYRVAQSLAAINHSELPPRDIVRRRSSNYYVVNTESEIEAQTLEYLLQRELERLTLNVDFEYAIFDCYTEEMVYGGYCTYEVDREIPDRPPSASELPPEADFTYYFGVKFPTRNGYIWGEMQLVVFLSLLLLLTMAFFVYSMSVILRQKRLSELQKDFINNMTHEFKTPLSTIRIAASVFQRDPYVQQDQRLQRYADIIHEQYARLNNQVEKVLQLAQIERGNFQLKREVVDLNGLLQPLISATQLRIEELSGDFSYELPTPGLRAYADPLHLSNMLHSLLDNAIKYRGEGPLIVELSTSVDVHQQLLLRVRDHGPGIPADLRERIFEKFYRRPTGDRHDVKGFGLGLYYVHQICQAHGWSIKAEAPTDGPGALFILKLPLTTAPVPAPKLQEP
ncbi:MAG: HAMP domain-containing sensor histidine kinase [Bacteroidota bacterium]